MIRALVGSADTDGPRRRSLKRRLASALRDHVGTGLFIIMLVACLAMIGLSRA